MCEWGALKHVGIVAWCVGIAVFIGLTVVGHRRGRQRDSASAGDCCSSCSRASRPSRWPGPDGGCCFPRGRLRLRPAVLLRFIREAVNSLLPLTQVGGDIVGARLLTFWAVPGPLAAASIIIDVLVQAATQFLFTALGLVMLIALGADKTVVWIAATGLAFAIPMLGGFYFAQREGGRRIFLRAGPSEGRWQVGCAGHCRCGVPKPVDDLRAALQHCREHAGAHARVADRRRWRSGSRSPGWDTRSASARRL